MPKDWRKMLSTQQFKFMKWIQDEVSKMDKAFDNCKPATCVLMDFPKIFETTGFYILMETLREHGLRGKVMLTVKTDLINGVP